MVIPTMAAVAVNEPLDPRAYALLSPVLTTTVSVPAPTEAPVASAGRAAPALAVAPMAAAAFTVTAVPEMPM